MLYQGPPDAEAGHIDLAVFAKVDIFLSVRHGLMANSLHIALIMVGVMELGRPAVFNGGFVCPKTSMFERMRRMVRGLQPKFLAILSSVTVSSPSNSL